FSERFHNLSQAHSMPPPAKRARTGSEWKIVRFRIPNPSELTEKDRVKALEEHIDGFPISIRFRVKNVEGTDRLAIYAHCDMNKLSAHWFCDYDLDASLVNQVDEQRSVGQLISGRFDPTSNHSKAASFLASHHLNPAQGFLQNKELVVEAKIRVTNSWKRLKNQMDFMSPSDLFDVTLIVEDEKVYAGKQFLASQSPVLKALFFGGYKETKENEIRLKDVDMEGFMHLLNYLYRTGEGINSNNIEHLLRVADKFCITSVLDEVESYLLVPNQQFPLAVLLRLSDQYRLESVLEKYLPCLNSCEKIRELKKSTEYESLSERTKERLFDMYIKKHEMEEGHFELRPIPRSVRRR
ncbi:hypothetical protein PMAYCL1PPCAC_01929, partial [Pristionchus mayeri]